MPNLSALSTRSVVRFYLRDKSGRFSSIKWIYMPARNQLAPGEKVTRVSPVKDECLNGHLVYISCGGRTFKVKANVSIPVKAINWGSFKVVSE